MPEAANRAARDPETIRRWIRTGKLKARKIGTQHFVDETDLDEVLEIDSLPVPHRWRRFDSGRPQPNWAGALAQSRRGR